MTLMTVKIRKELGIKVKPEAEEIDGKTYNFTVGWVMNDEDAYPTETAYIPRDPNYPDEAPIWIASGDLIIQQQGLTG